MNDTKLPDNRKLVVYKYGNEYSAGPRKFVGVADNHLAAITLIANAARTEGITVSQKQIVRLLDGSNQTRGYQGRGEFFIENIELNKCYYDGSTKKDDSVA